MILGYLAFQVHSSRNMGIGVLVLVGFTFLGGLGAGVLGQRAANRGKSCVKGADVLLRRNFDTTHGLRIFFGSIFCKITLVGQTTPLFGFLLGTRSIPLPSQLQKVVNGQIMDLVPDQVKQVTAWQTEAVRTVFSVGYELRHCTHRGHHHDLIRCLAWWIYSLKPPVDFMPDPIKKVANGQIMDLVPDQVRKVANGQIMDLVPDQVRKVGNGQIMDLVPDQVKQVTAWDTEAVRTVFSVGFELMHCHHRGHHHDLIRCLAGWIYGLKPPVDFMPDPIKKVANGQIMDLVPDQVKQVTAWQTEAVRTVFSVGYELRHCTHRGHHHDLIRCLAWWIYSLKPPVDFMPDPIKKVANGQIMDLVPDQVRKVANGQIMDLVPDQVRKVANGQIMDLVPDQVRKVGNGQIMDLVPDQVKQVTAWDTEAVRTVFSVGFELMHCHHRGHHHDLIRCLAGWIYGLKPPVDFMPDPIKKVANGQIMDLVPDQVKQVTAWQTEAVRTVFSVGFELMHCHHRGHHHDLIRCLAGWIYGLKPPVDFMPEPVMHCCTFCFFDSRCLSHKSLMSSPRRPSQFARALFFIRFAMEPQISLTP